MNNKKYILPTLFIVGVAIVALSIIDDKKKVVVPEITPVVSQEIINDVEEFIDVKFKNGYLLHYPVNKFFPAIIQEDRSVDLAYGKNLFIDRIELTPNSRAIIFVTNLEYSGSGGPAGFVFTIGPNIDDEPLYIGKFVSTDVFSLLENRRKTLRPIEINDKTPDL